MTAGSTQKHHVIFVTQPITLCCALNHLQLPTLHCIVIELTRERFVTLGLPS